MCMIMNIYMYRLLTTAVFLPLESQLDQTLLASESRKRGLMQGGMAINYSSSLNVGLGLGHTVGSDSTLCESLLAENSRRARQVPSAEAQDPAFALKFVKVWGTAT